MLEMSLNNLFISFVSWQSNGSQVHCLGHVKVQANTDGALGGT